MPDGPLSDLIVLDLTRALAGPHAAMMLGDMGARVIKIESPSGDDTRSWGPPFVGPEEARESTYFLSANRNKESLVLDLKADEDKEVLARLVARADVLMENFRVGVLDRLGFPVSRLHELNPGLVVLSITGFGHDGPEAKRAGYDQIAQGEGGLMSITGTSQPTKVGVPIADLIAGMNGAFGVLAALHERTTTGRGRVVRTSLLSGMVGVHAFQGTRWTVAREVPGLAGDHHPSIAPYGMFATASAPIQIACGSEGLWRALCAALDQDPAEEQFATNPERVAHRDALIERLEGLFAAEPAEHWLSLLSDAGVPSGKVRSMDDVYSWDQTRSQGLLLSVDTPDPGRHRAPGQRGALRRPAVLRRPLHPRRAPDPRPAQRVGPGVARLVSRDWHAWHDEYADPASSLSRRLDVVRSQLRGLLTSASGPVRLVSMCSGDGRDTLPVLAETGADVTAVLVELDPGLAESARRTARELGLSRVDVRTADAGSTDAYADGVPADVLLACGVFGNVTDADLARTVATLPCLVADGAHVIWTRGQRVPQDPTEIVGDPSELVRALFLGAGFEEVAFVRPDDASFRVGVSRWPSPGAAYRPGVRMFDFV